MVCLCALFELPQFFREKTFPRVPACLGRFVRLRFARSMLLPGTGGEVIHYHLVRPVKCWAS